MAFRTIFHRSCSAITDFAIFSIRNFTCLFENGCLHKMVSYVFRPLYCCFDSNEYENDTQQQNTNRYYEKE